MVDNKKEVNIHIIHSMKGGCGKSTCALFKAIQTAFNQVIDDKKARVLFIDADFKGSAMTELLFNRDKLEDTEPKNVKKETLKLREVEENIENNLHGNAAMKGLGKYHRFALPNDFDHYITLSDYLRDSSKYAISDIICESCSYESIGTTLTNPVANQDTDINAEQPNSIPNPEQPYFINGYIDFMLSSASSESKNWFRYMEGKISAGVYRWRMDTIIRNILKIGAINDESVGTYTDIVIDMPPGYDEYSDILLELLRENAQKESKRLKLHYYAVTTEDIGHTTLTKNNIKGLIADDVKYESFETVNLILNAASIEEFKDLVDDQKENYRNWLKLDNAIKGKLYLNENSESYHKFCRTGKMGEFEQSINDVLKKI